MHKPEAGPGSGALVQDPNSQDWRQFEDSLEEVRNRCWQEKRKPPQRSTCGFCGRVFEGEGSWNERMEHVGGHYSRDLPEACKEEREDEDLTNWSLMQGVVKEAPNGRHVLVDQPVSSVDRPFTNRNSDMNMSDAPSITPTNGQMEGQFIDRLEDLINTLINPKKPRMSKRLQWRCDCGLDSSVDFADENNDDQRAFQNLGKISIICKNSQSPYLKASKTEQYEIIPCNELHGYIARENKIPTNHSLPRVQEPIDQHTTVETDNSAPAPEV